MVREGEGGRNSGALGPVRGGKGGKGQAVKGRIAVGPTGRGGEGPREREGGAQVSSSLPSHAGHPATPHPTSTLPLFGGGRRPAPGGLYRHPPPRPPARTGPRPGSRRRSEGSGGGEGDGGSTRDREPLFLLLMPTLALTSLRRFPSLPPPLPRLTSRLTVSTPVN